MKREHPTSWLYFCTLYCTGAQFAFIGWLCSTESTSNVAVLVSKYRGGKLLEL